MEVACQATRIVAIRHGQTSWNADGRIQGQCDIGLDATGLWQSERLAAALDDDAPQAIYSSDLQRAWQTAAPLARRVGVSVRSEPALRERAFGEFEGLRFEQIERRWPEQAARWRTRDPEFGPVGGEALARFRERVVEAVLRLALAHRGQCIVLVTHGGALDMLYREAARLPLQVPRTWQVANAGINRLLHGDSGLMLVGWADLGHLEAAPDATP